MSFELKIGLFWAIVFGIQWLARRFPDSVPARWLMNWNGPFPRAGETRSRYYRRKVRFALGWLLQLLVVSAALTFIGWLSPDFAKSDAALVSMFALTLGLGMALLGAFLATLASMKAAWLGPDPQFIVEQTADGVEVARVEPPSKAPL